MGLDGIERVVKKYATVGESAVPSAISVYM